MLQEKLVLMHVEFQHANGSKKRQYRFLFFVVLLQIGFKRILVFIRLF